MSDSLADILQNRDFDEPPESRVIKRYLYEQFQVAVEVIIRDKDILVTVTSAPLANIIRLRSRLLQTIAETDKRIVVRIR
jgi:hypothetical protein